jgi:hypothetical protein
MFRDALSHAPTISDEPVWPVFNREAHPANQVRMAQQPLESAAPSCQGQQRPAFARK